MRGRVAVVVVVVALLGLVLASCRDGRILCGFGSYSGQGGPVYCKPDDGTKCCLVLDEQGFGYLCIPASTECAPLTACGGEFVCAPQQVCLDDGAGIVGCATACLPPNYPCTPTACCTGGAWCNGPYDHLEAGCYPPSPGEDWGTLDAGSLDAARDATNADVSADAGVD